MKNDALTPSVFEFNDYREYLNKVLATSGKARGYRTELARSAGCHNSFLSQVLKHSVQLLPEHAYGLARFWNFSDSETEYFVLLVQHARSGSPGLRKWTEEKMARLKEGRLQRQLSQASRIRDDAQELFYSSWDYSAVYVLSGISKYQTVRAMGTTLRLSESRVKKVLIELETLKLVRKEKNDRWTRGTGHVHLDKNSPLTVNHHLQWRLRATQEINENRPDNLHFTGVHSVSMEDAQRIRKMLSECLEKISQLSRPSPEEELVVLTCDFARIS